MVRQLVRHEDGCVLGCTALDWREGMFMFLADSRVADL